MCLEHWRFPSVLLLAGSVADGKDNDLVERRIDAVEDEVRAARHGETPYIASLAFAYFRVRRNEPKRRLILPFDAKSCTWIVGVKVVGDTLKIRLGPDVSRSVIAVHG
ncbi:hypothetical protein MPEAHAMD_0622 [Methylobacterium frigidaeris]|uniref:Uncharacterized protein n=1 Tax=Methylobacterium frigidaeris TaxID=2038277 RepID=A0AA37H7R1_9HYPH|nr:hypothetical protein MPEAHAMD_0622 [Methylobacterium frigidaeris]